MKRKKRTKLINITQNDIDRGVKLEAAACPVARAVARAFRKRTGTYCVFGGFVPRGPKRNNNWPLPPEVWRFMWAFDNDKPVKPFSFVLEY
jgi:hypothetical protein